jgi:hypothetical protein
MAEDDDAGHSAEPDTGATAWPNPIDTEWSDPIGPERSAASHAPPATDDTAPSTGDAPPATGDTPPGPSEDDLAVAVLGAMHNRMHSNHRLAPGEDGYIRHTVGDGDDAVLVIDDGPDHCMVGHAVGQAPDDCFYALVARIALDQYADVLSGDLDPTELFTDARDISLCGVVVEEDEVSNVFLVQHYRRVRAVPADYLPGSPFLEFTDDPDVEA